MKEFNPMIRRLRQKFVATNMALVSIVLIAVFAFLLTTTWQQQRSQTVSAMYRSMDMGSQQKPEIARREPGTLPMQPRDDHGGFGGGGVAVFWAVVQQDGTILQSDVQQVDIDDATLSAVISEALADGGEAGSISNPDLRFLRKTTAEGIRFVFADRTAETSALLAMALRLAAVGAAALLAFFGISLWLAGMAVRPVEQAWAQQHQFVADASHELKTPLTVILTSASLLAAHPDDTVKSQQKWLSSIADEGAHMKQLINDLLFLAKNDATRAPVLNGRVDWSDTVLNTALSFEAVAFENGVTLDSDVAEGLFVQGDGSQLKQLAAILLDNACKYAASEKRVTVTLQEEKGSAVLSVRNTGTTIQPADLPHIFERFYRTDRARTAGGFGLGLAIAKSICDTHHGSIRAESADGVTAFTVTLPVMRG